MYNKGNTITVWYDPSEVNSSAVLKESPANYLLGWLLTGFGVVMLIAIIITCVSMKKKMGYI